VEHLIRSGVIHDPDPLTRPLKRGPVLTALRAVDTTTLPSAVRATVKEVISQLSPRTSGNRFLLELYGGPALESQRRRDPLRDTGSSVNTVYLGTKMSATFGPVVVAHHTRLDKRIWADPEYTGRSDTAIKVAAYQNEAYISIQARYGEFFLGALQRNWGPTGVDGFITSAEPYSYDHAFYRLGVSRARVEGLVTQLDDYQVPAPIAQKLWGVSGGAPIIENRYWSSTRVFLQPFKWLGFTIDEGTMWWGTGRSFEFRWINPVRFSPVTRVSENTADSLLAQRGTETPVQGTGFILLPHGWVLQGALVTFDDWHPSVPIRGALTAAVDGPLSKSVAVKAFYTLVTSLIYRSPDGHQEDMDLNGVGLGRNWSDYDQFTANASVLAWPMVVLSPEITYLRQGQGDFRQPFPDASQWSTFPALHLGVTEKTFRLGSGITASRWGNIDLQANLGVNFIRNYQHVMGQSSTRVTAALVATYRFRREFPLPDF
jgi:hypothetical protein